MKQCLFSRRSLFLGSILAALAVAAPAQAATVDTSWCSNPSLSQEFLPFKDNHWYAPVPGEDQTGFDGTGWTLTGGAQIITTTLPNGMTGTVLDLPSGAQAVSPEVCVTSSYPTARSMVRDVVGSEGVSFYVSYEGTPTWATPKNTGQFHGSGTAWTLGAAINLQPNKTTGWQPVRFVFIGGGKTSDFQVYDFEVDPRMT